MLRVSFALVATGATLIASARAARAQSVVSLDGVVGPAQVLGGHYGDRTRLLAGLRVDLRVATRGANQILIGASTDYYNGYRPLVVPAQLCADSTGVTIPCYPPTPPNAPNFAFTALHVGVRRPFGGVGTIDLTAGIGQVRITRPWYGTRGGVSLGVRLAVHLFDTLHGVFGMQLLSWKEGASQLLAVPVSIGFRLN